ncbi:DUF3990 domain-containing protein [Sedimentibacter sp. zth1]|uniref:DUF3990 domain-containing protein n=1 Tax=Sedimentibacter sp. zth1 TaxID=2816908 RepID=UPI001A92577A|nr:DUF3990 domain-containing protein [Sedimentibacter sp. zth1]QSX06449.1 DUF3990 domain-containing protein [Sedimentibacter sp. zth1]
MDNIIYHGSNVIVEYPEIQVKGYYKDFGFGFYCTSLEKQAKRWALTKRPKHIINVYSFEVNENLSILKFDKMCDEWLDFVVSCRRGITHNYDIVEGPMADDTIWDYIEDFISETISREAFWVLVKFKYPTHQIVLCNDKALNTIRFERSYEI